MSNELIYGKNNLDRIVCIEPGDSTAVVFRELEDGSVASTTVPNSHYILFSEQHSDKFKRLAGNQPYKWLYETDSREKYQQVLSASYKKRYDMHVVRDVKEAIMLKDGYTYFKGMKVEDVSVLSFDIETNGLAMNADSQLFIIANAYRSHGKVVKKLFSIDHYPSEKEMLADWCKWVREVNPSVLVGHNVFGYDLPFLNHIAELNGTKLLLGRDGSEIEFNKKTSQYRKDGSQSYDYNNAHVYGREIVDTFFLAMKYDIARNYESYGLKQIVKQEGMEKLGRQHYDAGQIANDWSDSEKREQIKSYANDDVDDALKLYDLMIPSLFYYTQSVPRSFQQIINSATGSQINSLMVRGYLQQGHSIARGSNAAEYEGAISFGIPGLHKNVLRFDVASLYPSVMRQERIHSKEKDPQGLFLELVETFTLERLKNKALGKDTGERYYKDLEQSQKIAINSMYGFLGAPKLNYNYPEGASQVTRKGREVLDRAARKLTGKSLVEHGVINEAV